MGMKTIINFLLRPQWVAFTTHNDNTVELGLCIWGVVFALYKGDVYVVSNLWSKRRPYKREFGESLHPLR